MHHERIIRTSYKQCQEIMDAILKGGWVKMVDDPRCGVRVVPAS